MTLEPIDEVPLPPLDRDDFTFEVDSRRLPTGFIRPVIDMMTEKLRARGYTVIWYTSPFDESWVLRFRCVRDRSK